MHIAAARPVAPSPFGLDAESDLRDAEDLHALDAPAGTIHTAQRGLRSGIAFASSAEPTAYTLFYFQNFSALTGYFEATKRSPADCVGGRWPELGYAPPAGEECVLPKSRELVVSDAFLTVAPGAPASDAEAAAAYLDLLAETYLCLPRPPVEYHDWPSRAARTLRDLSLSPNCSYVRRGTRYMMPYVADEQKPPESMVQLTLAMNAGEYARWCDAPNALGDALGESAPAFFDEDVASIVRWLPGAEFDDSQAEANMNHDDMDSWYLHHASASSRCTTRRTSPRTKSSKRRRSSTSTFRSAATTCGLRCAC